MKRAIVIFLLTSILCWTSCSRPQVFDDSSWVRPIEFSVETKEWFRQQAPLPPYVIADLQQIVRHNRAVRAVYGNDQPPPPEQAPYEGQPDSQSEVDDVSPAPSITQ